VLEFGQQIFTIIFVIVQIMFYGGGLLAVLINREKIMPVFFVEMNFDAVINPEIKIEQLIQVPAEAVLLNRSHNA
jgi:hypothetical protein